jgi:TM2 domain-containing membrane protein YozV
MSEQVTPPPRPLSREEKRLPHPMLALAFSFLFTGLGQIYNRQYAKGVLFVFVQFVNFALIYWFVGLLIAPAFWAYGLLDAVGTAARLRDEFDKREALQGLNTGTEQGRTDI